MVNIYLFWFIIKKYIIYNTSINTNEWGDESTVNWWGVCLMGSYYYRLKVWCIKKL